MGAANRHRTRVSLLFGVILGIAAVSVVALDALGGTTYSAVPTPEIAQELQQVATTLGSGNLGPGSTPPTTAQVVLTTRGDALSATSGDTDNLDPSTSVYVVQLEGATFVGCMAKALNPTSIEGQSLVFVFDPASSELTDWSIEQEPIDLSGLGVVSNISINLASVPCSEAG